MRSLPALVANMPRDSVTDLIVPLIARSADQGRFLGLLEALRCVWEFGVLLAGAKFIARCIRWADEDQPSEISGVGQT